MYNFEAIFRDCKQRFHGFNKEIDRRRKPRSFEEAIFAARRKGLNPVITEVKPASPKGTLREIKDVGAVVEEMRRGGACGISVLTEEKFFHGSLSNLEEAAETAMLPVLRKDFLFHPDQVREAYYYGADSVLLIAGLLANDVLEELVRTSRDLGMEPIVEVHSGADVDKAQDVDARLVLINNRDMETLEIDLERSRRLSEAIDGGRVKISASGISNPQELRYVLEYCDAALIGTSIMLAENIEKKVKELVYG